MAETDSVKPGDTSGASAHAEPAHPDTPFDLMTFVPFLLNEAAETVARRFSRHYSERYDMTRSQWRIMANLGRNGKLTATELCHLSHLEKSVVSRAVHSMEDRGWIHRQTKSDDRRFEHLMLTAGGLAGLD
ncbi:MAG: MarR family winged helix-turn-helix transcriptional regulator, partial [Pseudomonadota bacterium]